MEPKIYVYKMTTDNGGAPCVKHGILSLAICKPEIRRMAKEGAIIFGFGAKKAKYEERLIYVAKVTKQLSPGEYYQNKSGYLDRPDCIYEYKTDRKSAKRRSGTIFHLDPKWLKHDVGKNFERGYVLLSEKENFRYFGAQGNHGYRKHSKIKKLVTGMGRGYRVNHDSELYNQLSFLQSEILDGNGVKEIGTPTEPQERRDCTHC